MLLFSPTHAAKSADQRRRILGRSQKVEKNTQRDKKRRALVVWCVTDTLAKFKSKTSSQANTYARSKTLINALLIAIMLAHITLFLRRSASITLWVLCCADFALLAQKHFFITPPAPFNRAAFFRALNLKGH